MHLTKHPELFPIQRKASAGGISVTITCTPFSIRSPRALLGGMVGCRFVRTACRVISDLSRAQEWIVASPETEGKKETNFLPAARKRCHLLSRVIELTVWHRYPRPSLHVINPWYNYFLSKNARHPPEVFRWHDRALKRRDLKRSIQTKEILEDIFSRGYVD